MFANTFRTTRVFLKKNVFRHWEHDFPASIVVYLVALPLCLGISLASDAPMLSGMITGIVAGLVVSWLSGSELSVSGPAAGLTVIVAAGIGTLGNFEAFLCAVVISGLLQIVFGLLKGGVLANVIPSSVIKGMLAAIGITIILKQLPHIFGGFDTFGTDVQYLDWNALQSIFASVKVFALVIALGSLALLILWESPKIKRHRVLSKIPGPLAAVFFGAATNALFHSQFPSLALHAQDGHLVQLPVFDSLSTLLAQFRSPDFSTLTNQDVWLVALTIACVGSVETLLCLESTDKLDPYHRVSNPNRELVAQGIGNILVGLLGGIPMTSVIVRSSANVYSGARTRLSSFLHGGLLLISVLVVSKVLNFIPLASLAAVLIVVGFKLAHPSLFKKMLHAGSDQFIPFAVTVVAILLTDLLKGVLIGVAVGLVFVLRSSYYSAVMVVREGKDVLVRFTKDVTFIHKAKLRKELAQVEKGSRVYFDGSRAVFFDRDILEMLQEFEQNAPSRHVIIESRGVSLRKKNVPKPVKTKVTEKPRGSHGIVQETSPSQ